MKTNYSPNTRILFLIAFLSTLIAINRGQAQTSRVDSAVFDYKGSLQTWNVPQGVTKVHIDAYGAQGGSVKGGKGGRVQSDLSVKPGDKLVIYIGSQPKGNEPGYNGGGAGCGNGFGGGGATDIRVGGEGLNNRVIVAGGGGGHGYGGKGGAGGDLTGGQGIYDTSSVHIAKGGTQTEGGAAARAYLSAPGKYGIGGDALDNHGVCSNGAMGGGGGGYYGGGSSGAGGGGGGSSFTSSTCSSVVHSQGIQEGNGRLVIYWSK